MNSWIDQITSLSSQNIASFVNSWSGHNKIGNFYLSIRYNFYINNLIDSYKSSPQKNQNLLLIYPLVWIFGILIPHHTQDSLTTLNSSTSLRLLQFSQHKLESYNMTDIDWLFTYPKRTLFLPWSLFFRYKHPTDMYVGYLHNCFFPFPCLAPFLPIVL